MLAASVLFKEKLLFKNIPKILDIEKLLTILEKMGAKIHREQNTLSIDCQNLAAVNPDFKLVKSMRASVVLVGPLLARFGYAKIPHPGGDKIGSRPIDMHIKAFKDLGVDVEINQDVYIFKKRKLINNNIEFDKITVTGTENIILFAVGFNEKITIINAAIEPEINDLINFLSALSLLKVVLDSMV
jgi:UDP-N-acetylglucosamine 1-carboxyvinyltransferase